MKTKVLFTKILILPAILYSILNLALTNTATAQPTAPKVFLETTFSKPAGTTHTPQTASEFQAALDNAKLGDIILLEAGKEYEGKFTLPAKSGSGWIYIMSSKYAQLPAPGTRITPASENLMPKLFNSTLEPVIETALNASFYRLVGLHITTGIRSTDVTHYNLLSLGAPIGTAPTFATLPSDIIVDRCYIHGNDQANVRRGIALNNKRTAVIDSYVSEIHEIEADSQAIGGWEGSGPFKIVNNYLEGAGENVMFGGSTARVPCTDPDNFETCLVPSDIEFRRNYLFKPLSWKIGNPNYKGKPWSVKNLFELKNAQRVLIEGNIFKNNWPHAQNGMGILFTPRGENNTMPWARVRDVIFLNNLISDSSGGFNIMAKDETPSLTTKRILITNNLMINTPNNLDGGQRNLFQLLNSGDTKGLALDDIEIEHNTSTSPGNAAFAFGDDTNYLHRTLIIRDNILHGGANGIFGSGAGEGNSALNAYTSFPFVKGNVLVLANSNNYPADNSYVKDISDIGLTSIFNLSASSPFKNKATDGIDPGVILEDLLDDIKGVDAGVPTDGSPGNPGTQTPVPTTTSTFTPTPTPKTTINPGTVTPTPAATQKTPTPAATGTANSSSKNKKPVVTVISPTDGTTVNINSPLKVEVTVTSDDGIKHVDIFVTGARKCRVTQPPYSCDFTVNAKKKKKLLIYATAKSNGKKKRVGKSKKIKVNVSMLAVTPTATETQGADSYEESTSNGNHNSKYEDKHKKHKGKFSKRRKFLRKFVK